MKNLTKILGLIAMLTLVSCGSKSPNMSKINDCINESKCQDLGETPVVDNSLELTFDRLATGVESITYKGAKLTLLNTGDGWKTFARVDDFINPGIFVYKLRRILILTRSGLVHEFVELKTTGQQFRHATIEVFNGLANHAEVTNNWGDTPGLSDDELETFEIEDNELLFDTGEETTLEFTEDFLNGVE